MKDSGSCRSIWPRKMRAPRASTSELRAAHVRSRSGRVSPRSLRWFHRADAERRQGVEDRGSQWAAVDECAADIVHDVGVLGDDPITRLPISATESAGGSGIGGAIAVITSPRTWSSTALISPALLAKWCCTKPTDTPAAAATVRSDVAEVRGRLVSL